MSETVIVACSHCGKKSKLKSGSLGKTVRCPGCKERFEASAPVAAQSSGTSKRAASGGNNAVFVALAAGALGLAVIGAVAFAASGLLPKRGAAASSKAAAVESFAHYNAKDAAFACDYPDGWDMTFGGAQGNAWAQFKNGATYIKFSEKVVGNLLGDIAGNRTEDDGEVSAVESVHAAKKQFYEEEEFKNYKEDPSEPVKCGFGKARRSTFTASGGWGKNMKGYRVTVLGAVRQIDIICLCPAADFDTLKPAFEKSISSLAVGLRV